VSNSFGCGITIPLPKPSTKGTLNEVDDYRGITILPIISKLFEFTLQRCMAPHLGSSISQFGYKKGHSCAHAIFETFSLNGSTVNVCSLDICKAFDNVNHIKLFNKLMDRHVSVNFIHVLISWYSKMEVRVKWGGAFSHSIHLAAGVRQGFVLVPSLFALYVHDLLLKLNKSGLGSHIKNFCYNALTSYLSMLLKKHMLTDPIVFEIIISQNQNN